jgi:hypothetical protein
MLDDIRWLMATPMATSAQQGQSGCREATGKSSHRSTQLVVDFGTPLPLRHGS